MTSEELVGKIILSVMFGLPLFLIAMRGVSRDWNSLCLDCCRKRKSGVHINNVSNMLCKFYHCKGKPV